MGKELGVELELERGQTGALASEDPASEGDRDGEHDPDVQALITRISLEAEVPEVLFDGMREFIRTHPQWDQYRLITAALASFLFQNGSRDACVTQHYLNGLVRR